jgi:L-ascorbate 6-phosphate lactonase
VNAKSTSYVKSGTDDRPFFTRNDPYARDSQVEPLISQLIESSTYMGNIRSFVVPPNSIAAWYLGQNGFILKGSSGPLIAIDPYLTNSCASSFAHLPFRLDRQLPVFIEPEDLDIDIFITTHSHQDHADSETIRRMNKDGVKFLGPFDSLQIYRKCGVASAKCELMHPGHSVALGDGVSATATFALPTDDTDLNHSGILLQFANGITFYDTGDTAFSDGLHKLLPKGVDVCAICMNGGFRNLSHFDAARIIEGIRPKCVIPCHYDMMINNVASPEMLRVSMDVLGVDADFIIMSYYQPTLFPIQKV